MSKHQTIVDWYMECYTQAANLAAFYARWADFHRRHKRMQHAIAYQEKSARVYREAHHTAQKIMYLNERVSLFDEEYPTQYATGGLVTPQFFQMMGRGRRAIVGETVIIDEWTNKTVLPSPLIGIGGTVSMGQPKRR